MTIEMLIGNIKYKHWMPTLFIILFILRSFTDNTSFSGPFDIMFFTIYFDYKREKSNI